MENLPIFDRTGLPFDGDRFPHRLGITNANATYRDYYSRDEKALVERIYAKELHTFDYDF